LHDLGGGEGGGFVGVGVVDGDVEGLVGYLPEEGSGRLERGGLVVVRMEGGEGRTPRPGVSMPAVTTKLERTKEDMRKGSITGSPVSASCQYIPPSGVERS
jgi:hypothetical protein